MTVSEKLYKAYKENSPVALASFELNDKEVCYKIQDEVLKLKEHDGEKLQGYKISLTSEQTQKMFNSDSPLYGGMTDVTVKNSLSLKDYNQPLLELELVFLVDEEVTEDDTVEDVMRKCRVAPGIEVPDARFKDWFPHTTLYEVVADGAVNGAVAYGEAKKFTAEEVADISGKLYFNGEFVKEGRSKEVLGHPANSVLWLAKVLKSHGKKVHPGLFVSTGTFILPVALEAGTYTAEYENFGSVKLEVSE